MLSSLNNSRPVGAVSLAVPYASLFPSLFAGEATTPAVGVQAGSWLCHPSHQRCVLEGFGTFSTAEGAQHPTNCSAFGANLNFTSVAEEPGDNPES